MLLEHIDIPVTKLNENDKEIPESSGVYAYIEEDTGYLYIGKAVNLKQRYRQHKYNKKGKEGSIDYQLYNFPENFTYRILIYGVDPSVLESLEGTFIQRYDATKIGYNIRDDKPKSIDPEHEEIYKAYSKLRKDYMELHFKYTEMIEKMNSIKNSR